MRTRYLAMAALLAAVPAAACTGDQSAARVSLQATTPDDAQNTETEPPVAPAPLEADRIRHDFGDVPIGGGNVEAVFRVTNAKDSEVRLAAVYTSCMCTTAVLEFANGSVEGPFGMPGHELPIEIDRALAPGESVLVRASFDPAAHGPEGVGPTRRRVVVHTADGGVLRLDLTANVTSG